MKKQKDSKKVIHRLKDLFGGGNNKVVAQLPTNGTEGEGRLETDALPVDDSAENGNRRGLNTGQNSVASTPSASADLTASVVRELSDPNYNSLEVAALPSNGHYNGDSAMALATMSEGGALATPAAAGSVQSSTTNTMNVHNAQQQLVMQFSNVNKLHIGSVFNFNNNLSATTPGGGAAVDEVAGTTCGDGVSTSSGTAKRMKTPKTTSIVGMMQSQEEPNHRMLDTIATHLGEGWKEVMRKLGHSDGQIEQAIIDHQMHGGIKEVIYQLLLHWVRNADDGVATLGNITTLLWETDHRDCVQRMKMVWKAEANRKTSR